MKLKPIFALVFFVYKRTKTIHCFRMTESSIKSCLHSANGCCPDGKIWKECEREFSINSFIDRCHADDGGSDEKLVLIEIIKVFNQSPRETIFCKATFM